MFLLRVPRQIKTPPLPTSHFVSPPPFRFLTAPPSTSPPPSLKGKRSTFLLLLFKKNKERKTTKMMEEAIPSIWALFHGWFTPTVFFVLLNLVIGTIAVTSKGIRRDADGGGDPRKLVRAPSLVLDRLRSLNLHRYRSSDISPENAARSEPLETLHALPDPAVATDFEVTEEIHALEADPPGEEHHQFSQSQSDAPLALGEVPVKLAVEMKKSASDNSLFVHFEAEEAEVVPRPATARPTTGQREAKEEEEEEEEKDDEGGEVDARADDFINRFRQQLKLQRLDSIERYKNILNRRAG